MALDAQGRPRAVGVVVMAGEAIDRTVFVVGEIELQPARAGDQGLAQLGIDRGRQKCRERRRADRHGAHDETRMPSEHPLHRRLPRTWRRTPCPQQHEEGADRDRDVERTSPAAADVARRDDDVHGDERRQCAGKDDVRGLKASMTLPETAAQRPVGEQHEGDEQERGRDACELIERGGGLEILDDGAVGEQQPADMQRRQDERRPADCGVQAQGYEGRGVRIPRPQGRAAQGDAGNRRRKAGPLGQLPCRADETRNGRQSEQHHERGAQEGDARIKARQDDARRGAKVA